MTSSRQRRLDAAREQLRTSVPVTALARAQLASARSPRGIAYAPGVDPRQSPEVREHVRSIDETIRAQVDQLNRYLDEQNRARALAEQAADGDPDAVVAHTSTPVEGDVIVLGDWTIPVRYDASLPVGVVHFAHRDRPPVLRDDPDLPPDPARPEEFLPHLRETAARLVERSGPLDPRAEVTITGADTGDDSNSLPSA